MPRGKQHTSNYDPAKQLSCSNFHDVHNHGKTDNNAGQLEVLDKDQDAIDASQ